MADRIFKHGRCVIARLATCALLAFSVPATILSSDRAEQPNATAGLEEFKIGKDGRLILLPVDVGQQRLLFLLDTGASISAFDISLQDLLGRPTGTVLLGTPSGLQRAEAYAWPEATLGRSKLKSDRPVACVDFRRSREASGEEIFGVIGMDVLRTRRMQIDFDKGVVRFLESVSGATDDLDEKVPLDFAEDGVASLAVSVDRDPKEPFRIDTGAHGCALRGGLFDQLVEQNLLRPGAPFVSITAAGQLRGKAGKLASFALESFSHRDLRFERLNTSALGLRYLSRFRVTFDFPKKMAYFRKGAHYSDPDPSATSGMTLNRIDGKTTVESVMKDGPADRAGLRPNDVLVEINGKDASSFDFFSLRQLLTSEVGRKVPMTALQSGRRNELEVILMPN